MSDLPDVMPAVVCSRYGGPEVLSVQRLDRPIPTGRDILVEVMASTVSSADARIRAMRVPTGWGLMARLMLGMRKPRRPVLGMEMAGVVVAVGPAVTRWTVGEEVFLMDSTRMGCHARFKCIDQSGPIARKPPSLSFEDAATLPFGGTTALYFLERAAVRPGESILIIGASGAVGTAMVQLARIRGMRVSAVCSARNAALVRALGAGEVLDYQQQDGLNTARTHDVVVDLVGAMSVARMRTFLRRRGRLVLAVPGINQLLPALWNQLIDGSRVIVGEAAERSADLEQLARLAASGDLLPVVDSRWPLRQVAQAHAHVDRGHKVGSVVLQLGEDAC